MQKKLIIALTLLLSGRAMTLAFIHRVGGSNPGDPPPAWLMPLVGDAVIGLSALLICYLLLTQRGLGVWVAVITWNIVAIWDALSAFAIHTTNPWPEFFMIQTFGPSMFFMASAMHLLIIILACRPQVKDEIIGYSPLTTQGT